MRRNMTLGLNLPKCLPPWEKKTPPWQQLAQQQQMVNYAYQCSQGSSGTLTLTYPASNATVVWNLTSLSISQAGPASGLNAKVTIYDGTVAAGTVIFAAFLNGPGALGTGIGSVGTIQEIPLPKTSDGKPGLQSSPGAQMNIVVTGTGPNQVIINARATDGLG